MIRAWLGLCAVCIALQACESSKVDNFECGVPVGNERDKATYCDGPNEKCICATKRCAVPVAPASERCASGYTYRFPPTDCVEPSHCTTALAENGQTAFCPDVLSAPPPCGDGADSGICGDNQLCLCGVREGSEALLRGGHRCVRRAPADRQCALGFTYTSTGDCVEGPAASSELILRSSDDPVCPDLELYPRRCGVPGALGNQECPSGQFCLCGSVPDSGGGLGVQPFTCLRQSTRCLRSNGQPGFEDRDGACLGVDPAQAVILAPGELVCPGVVTDGGRP